MADSTENQDEPISENAPTEEPNADVTGSNDMINEQQQTDKVSEDAEKEKESNDKIEPTTDGDGETIEAKETKSDDKPKQDIETTETTNMDPQSGSTMEGTNVDGDTVPDNTTTQEVESNSKTEGAQEVVSTDKPSTPPQEAQEEPKEKSSASRTGSAKQTADEVPKPGSAKETVDEVSKPGSAKTTDEVPKPGSAKQTVDEVPKPGSAKQTVDEVSKTGSAKTTDDTTEKPVSGEVDVAQSITEPSPPTDATEPSPPTDATELSPPTDSTIPPPPGPVEPAAGHNQTAPSVPEEPIARMAAAPPPVAPAPEEAIGRFFAGKPAPSPEMTPPDQPPVSLPDQDEAAKSRQGSSKSVKETVDKPPTPKSGSRPASAKTGSRPSSAKPGSKPSSKPSSAKRGETISADKPPTGKKSSRPTSAVKTESVPGSVVKEDTAPPPTADGDITEATTVSHTPHTDGDITAPSIPDAPPNILTIKTATPLPDDDIHLNALNMVWSFGMNRHVPVLNVTNDERKMIAYTCAHTVILYDFVNNKQQLLHGHSQSVSCTCISADKRWLASGDKGDDSVVIVWDTYTGIPVQTLFDAHPCGVAAIALTPDAKYLATLTAEECQVLSIWDWTTDSREPMCSVRLQPGCGYQDYILFNPEDTTELVTNSDGQVVFYSWKNGTLEYFAPPLTDDVFNKQVGKYSQTIYQTGSSRCLTGTSVGNLVVWDISKTIKNFADQSPADRKALKLVKLQERGISVLTTTDRYIVTGDVIGHVRFLDQSLKLVMWYQDINLGAINALSFAHFPDFDRQMNEMGGYPDDATIGASKFVIRDFVLGTTQSVFAQIATDGTDISVIHRDHCAPIHAMACHPKLPLMVVGSYSGLLKVWDYEKKETVVSRYFEKGNLIRCCKYDPEGDYLAVGFINGHLRILNAETLDDEVSEPFSYARDAITHLAFSHDSRWLAAADAEYTVSVFKKNMVEDESWIYLGRNRAHYKLIKDIVFGIYLDTYEPRLMSVGEDRVLVEYNLKESSKDNLKVLESERIEQSAVPLCMCYYPPVTKEHFFLTANDQYKFKLYNATTKMCRRTILGPTYGSPLQKIEMIPLSPHNSQNEEDTTRRYMAYITDDKVGLHVVPLDGNPHNSMALVAHPTGVTNLACSYDGRYIFTSGGVDCSVHMWQINIPSLEGQSKLGGSDLIPFYGLLDGGRDGELFAELENYFYYAQIRSQGVNTMDLREVSTTIPLTEVPFVMRAMGFYPSEQEIMDMLNEVKYSNYVETGKYVEHIHLGDFIKLYINHRPAFGLSPEKLKWAFETLGFPHGEDFAIDRGELLELLQQKGEHMTEYELAEYLTTLLGYNAEGGTSEQIEFDPSTTGDIIEENLPQDVSAAMFSDELLGFSMYSDFLPPTKELTDGKMTHVS